MNEGKYRNGSIKNAIQVTNIDENINKSILEKIANRKPQRIVFIESNFKDNDNSDSLKGNLLENFKMWLDMDDKSVMDMVKVI